MSDDESGSSSAASSQSTQVEDVAKSNSDTRDGDNKAVGAAEIRHAVALAAEAASKAFGWDQLDTKRGAKSLSKKTAGGGNELSQLIPGYTAPMRLEAKSLQGITGASLSELRNRASRGDAAAYTPAISILNKNNDAAFDPAAAAKKVKTPSSIAIQKSKGRGGAIPTSFSSSFRKAPRKQHDNTAGSGWFGMAPTAMTDQLKTDLSIIRNRNYLDPKKFYKSADSFEGKVLQVGTVIEGSAEFYSSRLTKRDRRQNLTEEIMADSSVSNYAKRKYQDIQMERAKPKRKGGGSFKKGKKRR